MVDRSTVSTRRYEAYVRWTAYGVATAPALSPVSAALPPGWVVGGEDLAPFAAVVVLALALSAGNVLVTRWSLDHVLDRPRRLATGVVVAWLLALVALVAATLAFPAPDLRMTAAVAAGSAAASLVPVLDTRRTLYLNAAFVVVAAPLAAVAEVWFVVLGLALISLVLWSCWFGAWLLRVLRELQQAHEDRAALTLANERLRISRDLHDVLGRTLTTIAVKSELASELVRHGSGERAAVELAGVRRLAGEAGTEVRRVVRGEARVTWDGEVSGARSLLDSAGIRCTVAGDPVPEGSAEGLAWVVREGVTNVLRHSAAKQVTLTTTHEDGEVLLTIANDGASRAGAAIGRPVSASGVTAPVPAGAVVAGRLAADGQVAPRPDGGTGLAAMSERIRALGGRIATHRDGDWFLLEATIPIPERDRA